MNIIKNCLSKQVFLNLKETMFSASFPWFFTEHCLTPEQEKTQVPMWQFGHNFYAENLITSNHYGLLNPIINILKPLSIIRIKANLNTQTEKIIETGLHTDIDDSRFKSAIFFLNTCDGYCRIENEKFFSEENKIIVFNSNLIHTGSTTTNQKRRIVISFVYLPSL